MWFYSGHDMSFLTVKSVNVVKCISQLYSKYLRAIKCLHARINTFKIKIFILFLLLLACCPVSNYLFMTLVLVRLHNLTFLQNAEIVAESADICLCSLYSRRMLL